MTRAAPLTFDETGAALARLPRWRLDEGHLVRDLRTSGWKATLMVVNAIGYLAESAWHHPDLIVSYARVTIRLRTHDADAVTARDVDLAARIDALLEGAGGNGACQLPPDARLIAG